MKITAKDLNEQRAYMATCDKARELGIPTSLNDPRTPRTVADLQAAVDAARLAQKRLSDAWSD